MPADQRPPPAGRVTGWRPEVGPDLDTAIDELGAGELTVEGRLPWSSNLTFLVSLGTDGPDPLRAVYKPAGGEQALWDFPDGLYRREVAAFVLSEALGWGIVPPTVAREDGPLGAGSLQLFVEADYEEHYFTVFDEGSRGDQLRTICAFDIVANNADRKSGHVLTGSDERLWAIDHGLCFHRQHKLRTVIWDFAGEEVPEGVLADLARLGSNLPEALDALLSEPEREAILGRITALVREGTFPEPTGDRPPYPWPLV